MRTIETKVYRYDELTDEAKKKARKCLDPEYFGYVFSESAASFEKFAEIFNIKWGVIDFIGTPRSNYWHNFDDDVLDLRGWRLATYIWNNYKSELFRGKYYGKLVKTFKDGTVIPVSKEHPAGVRHVRRSSKVFLSTDCVLTGVCYDQSLLKPIYDFLNKPDSHSSLADLIERCIKSLDKDVQNEYNYCMNEGAGEFFDLNDFEFTEDGSEF